MQAASHARRATRVTDASFPRSRNLLSQIRLSFKDATFKTPFRRFYVQPKSLSRHSEAESLDHQNQVDPKQPKLFHGEQTSLLGACVLASTVLDASTLSAFADESKNPLLPGVGIVSGTALLAPVILWAIFSVYRTAFNRNAKIGDFLLLVASVVIFGNILSALVFKVRVF